MKLLALEASQNKYYYKQRYQQIAGYGANVYVLNGLGTDDFWPADRYRRAGSKHVDALVRHAASWHAEEHFDGVFTFSESGVVAVAAVAAALGLPGTGVEAAITSRNKLLMRQAHERGGAAHPSFRFVVSLDAALRAAEDFGYPVIIKPTLGAASNFVFRVDNPDQMRERYGQCRAGIDQMIWFQMEADGIDRGPHGLLVESFLDAHEHLIEALVWDDEVYLGSIVDRITLESDTFDDDVHHAPTALTPEQVKDVHALVTAGVRAQGLTRSTLHAEVRFHQGKPFLLEIAIRPGGGGLDHMARLSAGYDPIKAVADVARGARPDVHHFRPTGVHTAAMCLICPGGVIESIGVPPEVSNAEAVYYLAIFAKPGDVIRRPPEGNSIYGGIGALGTSLDDALQTANDMAGKIEVKLVPPS
jgi:biotin carboxylase